jgi:Ni/Fe-hydrogenase subunit HybB-like protein
MVTGFDYAFLAAALLSGFGIVFAVLLKQKRYYEDGAEVAANTDLHKFIDRFLANLCLYVIAS